MERILQNKISIIMAASLIFCLTFTILGDPATDQENVAGQVVYKDKIAQGQETAGQNVVPSQRKPPLQKENAVSSEKDKISNTQGSERGTGATPDKFVQGKDNKPPEPKDATEQGSTGKVKPYGRMFKGGVKNNNND